MIRVLLLFSIIIIGCSGPSKQNENLNNDQINSILGQLQENDPVYTQKGISFDSIVTLAGIRSVNDKQERIKMKLFYFGDNCRGYFNLADLDSKNLQFFGKKVDNRWALKCVTKLNMSEVGGYIIFDKDSKGLDGIWSNGDVNFQKGDIILTKQELDYNTLTVW